MGDGCTMHDALRPEPMRSPVDNLRCAAAPSFLGGIGNARLVSPTNAAAVPRSTCRPVTGCKEGKRTAIRFRA